MEGERCVVRFGGREVVTTRGRNLRKVLLEAGLTPHNGFAGTLNCRGFGTCGTCAVAITGEVTPMTRRERWRLGFPPHRHELGREKGLRLACQCRIEGDLEIRKFAGFWGQKVDGEPTR